MKRQWRPPSCCAGWRRQPAYEGVRRDDGEHKEEQDKEAREALQPAEDWWWWSWSSPWHDALYDGVDEVGVDE